MQVTAHLHSAIRKPGINIRHLMALADISAEPPAQHGFWTACRGDVQDRTGAVMPDEHLVIERAREVCFDLIEKRVKSNELCMLPNGF